MKTSKLLISSFLLFSTLSALGDEYTGRMFLWEDFPEFYIFEPYYEAYSPGKTQVYITYHYTIGADGERIRNGFCQISYSTCHIEGNYKDGRMDGQWAFYQHNAISIISGKFVINDRYKDSGNYALINFSNGRMSGELIAQFGSDRVTAKVKNWRLVHFKSSAFSISNGRIEEEYNFDRYGLLDGHAIMNMPQKIPAMKYYATYKHGVLISASEYDESTGKSVKIKNRSGEDKNIDGIICDTEFDNYQIDSLQNGSIWYVRGNIAYTKKTLNSLNSGIDEKFLIGPGKGFMIRLGLKDPSTHYVYIPQNDKYLLQKKRIEEERQRRIIEEERQRQIKEEWKRNIQTASGIIETISNTRLAQKLVDIKTFNITNNNNAKLRTSCIQHIYENAKKELNKIAALEMVLHCTARSSFKETYNLYRNYFDDFSDSNMNMYAEIKFTPNPELNISMGYISIEDVKDFNEFLTRLIDKRAQEESYLDSVISLYNNINTFPLSKEDCKILKGYVKISSGKDIKAFWEAKFGEAKSRLNQ